MWQRQQTVLTCNLQRLLAFPFLKVVPGCWRLKLRNSLKIHYSGGGGGTGVCEKTGGKKRLQFEEAFRGTLRRTSFCTREPKNWFRRLWSQCRRYLEWINILWLRVNPHCKKKPIRFISVLKFPSSFCRLILSENLLMNTRGGVISSTSSTLDCEKRSVTAQHSFLPHLLLCNGSLAVSLTSSDSAFHAFQAHVQHVVIRSYRPRSIWLSSDQPPSFLP